MSKKPALLGYSLTSLLLLAGPYVLPTTYRYFYEIRMRTFVMMPWLCFVFAAAGLLPALLLAHARFFQRLSCSRKRLVELGLSALFLLVLALVYFWVLPVGAIRFGVMLSCCFLLSFTLLTAWLFGKEAAACEPLQK